MDLYRKVEEFAKRSFYLLRYKDANTLRMSIYFNSESVMVGRIAVFDKLHVSCGDLTVFQEIEFYSSIVCISSKNLNRQKLK